VSTARPISAIPTDGVPVDVMIVIGNEKLTIEMQKMFTKNGVTVISAPKSGGVSERVSASYHV
jgi:hypothetical protein